MTLTDQLRAILKKAGAPLSLNQIMELLPVGVDRNTVAALLSQRKRVGEFTHCVEDGRAAYAWAGVVVSDIAPRKVSEPALSREPVAPAVITVSPDLVKAVTKPAPAPVPPVATVKVAAPVIASLLEEVRDSSARVADALYEAIQACASKTLMAKLAVAHKALHEAHVELLGATGGGI